MTKPLQLKKELDRVNDILKHEAQTLSRLRHPSMLEVTEPLSDSSTVMAFATEPVLCNLSNVLGNFRNFSPPSQEDFKRKYELDELEIQKGILQLVKALQFLHSNRIIHGNICPESININAKGDWKVAGFNFAITLTSGSEGSSDVNAYINNFPPYCAPSLDYLAPEYVFDEKCDATSDGKNRNSN